MIITLDNALAHGSLPDLDMDVLNSGAARRGRWNGAALYAFCGAQLRQGIEIVTDALHLADQMPMRIW